MMKYEVHRIYVTFQCDEKLSLSEIKIHCGCISTERNLCSFIHVELNLCVFLSSINLTTTSQYTYSFMDLYVDILRILVGSYVKLFVHVISISIFIKLYSFEQKWFANYLRDRFPQGSIWDKWDIFH